MFGIALFPLGICFSLFSTLPKYLVCYSFPDGMFWSIFSMPEIFLFALIWDAITYCLRISRLLHYVLGWQDIVFEVVSYRPISIVPLFYKQA